MATQLKYLRFLQRGLSVQWISTILRTVKSKSLQRISIYPFGSLPETVEEVIYQEWRDLDCLLVQFWISHSIRPRVTYVTQEGRKGPGDHAPSLLPELTSRELVDLVKAS